MKPSPELIEAAREAFYNNQGDDADDPFELMLETLSRRGMVLLINPPSADWVDPDDCEEDP